MMEISLYYADGPIMANQERIEVHFHLEDLAGFAIDIPIPGRCEHTSRGIGTNGY